MKTTERGTVRSLSVVQVLRNCGLHIALFIVTFELRDRDRKYIRVSLRQRPPIHDLRVKLGNNLCNLTMKVHDRTRSAETDD